MPFAVRCTGLAFAYNLAIGLFGGTTPMINTLLVQWTAWGLAPALWVMAVALLSFSMLLFWIREPSREFEAQQP
jgi:MHS family proline/betaine transporter-like MFS transporter